MINSKIIFAISLMTAQHVLAGNGEYDVKNIPDSLMKNANVVKRKEEIRFEIVDLGKTREYVKYAITVLNENGDDDAVFGAYYDKLRSIESIDGILYDANGKKLKSVKKADIQDLSGTESSNLADDARYKMHRFYYKIYPYTVEYEVEYKNNHTMYFPQWEPQESVHYAVQESRMIVVCPNEYKFRYKAFNYNKEPVINPTKSGREFSWEVNNVPAIENEYASPGWNQMTTTVYLGPEQFQIEGYSGNMQSWQDLGKFTNALKSGRDELPDDVRQKVHQLADGIKDPKEKVRVLYEFLQQNTRYVSIQLGIGGWQPFDAKYVASKKYGDCKALSNYMCALLKEAGIRSCYTLIRAGEHARQILEDFPSQQFNHVILCVPMTRDTMWLECTSAVLPAGYLSGFTSDRFALIVDESGGKLVRTPKYGLKENIAVRKINASISNDGNLEATSKAFYKAMQQDDLEELINAYSKEKIMEMLKKLIDLPTYDVSKFDYKEEKSSIPPVVDEMLELTVNNYAQVSGKRIFINPNILNRSYVKLKPDDSRKYDLVLRQEMNDIDSVEIEIPTGYHTEAVPSDQKIESKFGRYLSSTKVSTEKIVYYRQTERFSGRFPPTEYDNLVKYYEQVYKADRSKVVLVKNE